MRDLTTALRHIADEAENSTLPWGRASVATVQEAAETIDRYQAALKGIAKANDSWPGTELAEVAQAALENREPRDVEGTAI